MRRLLSLLTHRLRRCAPITRRPLLELLEDRLAPSVTSLYVSTQAATTSGSLLKEYTPSGQLIRSVFVPTAGGTETSRDLAMNGQQALVYNGTFSPQLSAYTATSGAWTSTAGPAGWSTVNNVSYGGLAVLGGYAFATDMSTSGDEKGIVRFDLAAGTSDRFATDFEPIDVAAGLDGKLYALDAARTLRVYDPSSLALLNTITLPASVTPAGSSTPVAQDYRAVAVDPNGLIYAADWNRTLTRFSAAGVVQYSATLPTTSQQGLPAVGNLDDIDFLTYPNPNDGGLLAVGSSNGVVAEVSGQFFTLRTSFSAGTGATFVAAGPAMAELSINNVTVTEGSGGANTPATFTVTLSNPVAQTVSVNWTTQGSTASPGSDYQNASGILTFQPGETSKTVTVNVLDDTTDELPETFYVNLTSTAGTAPNAVIAASLGTGTILDDDPAATNVAVAAGSAANVIDSNGDGVFESAQATTGTLRPDHNTASREQRVVMEFDTTGINTSNSPYVTLDLYVEFPWFQSTQARVYAYPGNGTAEVADATRTAVQLGTIANLTNSSGGTAWRRITLDRTVIQSILNQSSVVGILITADSPTFFDIHGTGSAEAPALKFWNSAPPSLPVMNVSTGQDNERDPGAPAHYASFNVYLSQASVVPISVDYQTYSSASDATPNVDYVPVSGTLTFAPGETVKSVQVPILDDTTYEPTEHFYLQLSHPTYASLYTLSGAGTIFDNDPVPRVTVADATITEPDSGTANAAFVVSLSNPSYQPITVSYTTIDGSATAGSDYTAASGTLTFAPGETSKTVNVSVNGDTTFEQDETFGFALTSVNNAYLGYPNSATGTILNNDPVPLVGVTSVSQAEGNSGTSAMTFTVSLTNASIYPVYVNYYTLNGTAEDGSDYTGVSGSLTFAPGETSKTVTVNVNGDTTYEPDETFTLMLGGVGGAAGFVNGHQSGTGTIVNDDPVPTLTVSSPSVAEGSSDYTQLVFTLSLSNPSYQNILVYAATADGTAKADVDYMPASGFLTFAPGQTSMDAVVLLYTDTTYEPDETLTLNVSDPDTGAPIASGTGTIVNDDPVPTVSVMSTSVTEGDSGTTAVLVNVVLSNMSYLPVTVDYSTADGSATAGSDYTAASGTVTIAPGNLGNSVILNVQGDRVYEPDETFTVGLANAHNAVLGAAGTITIVNDDKVPAVTVSSPSVAEGDSGTAALTFTVTLSGSSGQPVTVNYATSDGTATAGSDYTATSGSLTFAPGETTKTVTISVTGDRTFEPDETLTLAVTDAGGSALASGTGTILNDDAQPTVSAAAASVAEGNTGTAALTFTVSLSNASYQTITVSYAASDGTATAGSDYTVASGTLTFAPGETSKTVTVSVTGDTTYEANETLTLTLSAPSNATLGTATATGIIVNDDPVPTVLVSPAGVAEGDSGTAALTFTVALSGPSELPIAVNYATADGSATAGSDYTAASGTLTFAPGETAKTVTVSVIGDRTYEPDETLTLTLTDAGGSTLASAVGTIRNDDAIPSISVGAASTAEGDSGTSALSFTVSLSNATYQTVTVAYATSDGSAVAGSDFTAASGTLTFAPGETSKTVSVSVTGDTTYEPNETLTLTLANPGNATLATASAMGTILNDDQAPTVAVSSPSVTEGDTGQTSAVFTISLSNPSYQALTVNYRTDDGTAQAGAADYITQSGTVTFAPGETTKTVSVVVRGDTTHEGNETFTLTASDTLGHTLATGTATILDDDPVPAVHISTGSLYEGNSGTSPMVFYVTLTNPTIDTVTVSYATADGTATAGSDYVAAAGTLTFAPGETGKQVLVSVIGDRTYEGTEQFVVKLSNPTNASLADTQADGIIGDDDFPTVTAASASVAEGDSGTTALSFTLSLSNPSVEPVTVRYATANGSAVAGSDYTAATGSVTFAPGQTTAAVVVSVTGDTNLEPDETFTVTLTLPNGTNATLGTTSVTGTILNDDYAPVANAGPDQTVNEGAAVAFSAAGSSDADNDPLTFTWTFGDGGTGSGVTASHTYADDGVYTATLTANDGHGGVSTDTMVVTVKNVAPTAAVSGPATAVRGQARTFTFSAADPSSVDQAAGFTYRVAWGDGTTDTVSGPGSGVSLTHVFTAAATVTVSATATDRNGGQGAAATASVAVKAVELQGADLVVGGTTGADHITLSATNVTGGVRVQIGGVDLGTFTPTGQIVVYAQAGDDVVDFATVKIGNTTHFVSQPLLIFGGDGNDTLDARNATGPAVLLGGAGNDTLYGGTGRVLLIGGLGSDTLRGGSDDDVFIGGTTLYDDNLTALAALRAEWSRTDANYGTRIAHLRDGTAGGLNGAYQLNASTVTSDGVFDDIYGNGGQDWFFSSAADRLNDRKNTETVTQI
jgi:hypothetical protein